jgi:hypothetical protein
MTARIYHQRAVVGSAITLEYVHRDQHGDRAEASSTPTVTVTRRSTGAAVTVGAVTAPQPDEVPVYKAVIAAANNDRLDELVATWTVDSVGHARVVSVVGAPYFSLDEAEDTGYETYAEPDAVRQRTARLIAERECERIVGRVYVPTFRQHQVLISPRAGADLVVPDYQLRDLIAVDEYNTDGTTIDYSWTAANLAAVHLDEGGIITRLAATWSPCLTKIGYEFGFDQPPEDIREAVIRRWRYHLAHPASAIPDRAISFSVGEGGTFRLSTPGPNRTGDPDVDAIYLSPEHHIAMVAR